MKVASRAKYLGYIITERGGSHNKTEKTRNEGWGKVSKILGHCCMVTSNSADGCDKIQK